MALEAGPPDDSDDAPDHLETTAGSACIPPFCFASDDGWFTLRFRSRLQVDLSEFQNDKNTNLVGGMNVRRGRLSLLANFGPDWFMDFTYEFTSEREQGIRDAFLRYTGFGINRIQVGNMKEPFGMERLTSVQDLAFMERSLASELTPDRNAGVEWHAHTKHWTAAAGVFATSVQETPIDSRYGVSGRATFAPRSDDGDIVHVGAGITHRVTGSSKEVRFRQRPESRTTDVRLIDTGTFLANAFTAFGVEGGLARGPWSIQGEFIHMHVHRSRGGPDVGFNGWHVDGAWIITGEGQPYNQEKGAFGRLRPAHSINEGGPGAVRLGLRFSGLDLSDADIDGGRQHNMAVNLSWYLNRYVTLMTEFVQVLDISGGEFDGARPFVIQARVQFAY